MPDTDTDWNISVPETADLLQKMAEDLHELAGEFLSVVNGLREDINRG